MRHNLSDSNETTAWPSYRAADSLLERLSGFPKYPPTEKGREVFIETLMTCSNPAQAQQVVDSFDEAFPTLRELRDAVYSVKARAENEALMGSQKQKWEAEGYSYDPDKKAIDRARTPPKQITQADFDHLERAKQAKVGNDTE